MWAVVVILLGMLTGPETHVVTDAGTFATQAKCQAAIEAAVPSSLDDKTRAEYKDGYRQYVCVHVFEHKAPTGTSK